MRDWITKLDEFLRLGEREILFHAGRISHEDAVAKAYAEYEKFRAKELEKPSPVEGHFIEAVKKVKKLETGTRKTSHPAISKGKKSRVLKRGAKKRAHQPLLRGRAKGRKGKKKRG
jgi:hypothetical protein